MYKDPCAVQLGVTEILIDGEEVLFVVKVFRVILYTSMPISLSC